VGAALDSLEPPARSSCHLHNSDRRSRIGSNAHGHYSQMSQMTRSRLILLV
jgi:hypothetical protein